MFSFRVEDNTASSDLIFYEKDAEVFLNKLIALNNSNNNNNSAIIDNNFNAGNNLFDYLKDEQKHKILFEKIENQLNIFKNNKIPIEFNVILYSSFLKTFDGGDNFNYNIDNNNKNNNSKKVKNSNDSAAPMFFFFFFYYIFFYIFFFNNYYGRFLKEFLYLHCLIFFFIFQY
jgi:hypothetical protein